MIRRPVSRASTLILATWLLVGPACAGEAKKDAPPVYDETADAAVDIATALARAKKDNKRVLVVYGGNWCGWCIKLDRVFQQDRQIKRTLLYEYEVVKVDVGRFDKHQEIIEKYGARLKQEGVPFLTVLSGDDKVVANQNTGDLEDGEAHDNGKLDTFLQSQKAPPRDAEELLATALAEAKRDGRRVLVHLGAPW